MEAPICHQCSDSSGFALISADGSGCLAACPSGYMKLLKRSENFEISNSTFATLTGTQCLLEASGCAQGFYLAGEMAQCFPCPANCASCRLSPGPTYSLQCTDCSGSFFLHRANQMCFATCPEPFFSADYFSYKCERASPELIQPPIYPYGLQFLPINKKMYVDAALYT